MDLHAHPPHLYVVEDDAPMRELIASYLEKQGLVVTAMASAKIGRPSARLRASAAREPSSTMSRRLRNCVCALASSAGP